ncbi:PTS system D-glucose-specific IIA component, Glc family /PTS system D-glucose-specific IIB component, Glc family /PTS system D-glucose-specific IIC component, Glc family [Fontibacillus panacisegetis]|uniref:PTS system D-glucose-specific IIA component, Glc family /PTS system D-glucose-specific IIB component, Glc family /PTS system D-glucose-specific IIC component, Glc family n=1 Tax=Fontibacillus panacisegetis TaxID=670482 RepID=A0A1G7QAG6_9BACL|nr:glucose-specific PTS transporter subunit IIBC [Fontibacillus panacisegetis]SDF95448.1 PTS system D-glucose-specific IIA component, Glc family /PTS system D-glucose-specific IIB component, Glc family /PTS system D-glucose-specific IIC component, Glc family [Fontibacillus panacisegetis]
MFKKFFGILQRVGKALMLPVALLPAAGLLLGIGNMLVSPEFLDLVPALDNHGVHSVAVVMMNAGQIIFNNLALLFAVGVAVGLAGGEGVAGLAAIIGYLVMNITMGSVIGVTPGMIGTDAAYANVLGIPTLATGVFGGIIVGILAASMYNRFFKIELPSYLGFFAGKRFVPIMTAATSIVLGLIMVLIWPPIQSGLNSASHFMLEQNRTLSAFIFGIVERALIPFGLHHIFYSPFWFEFGEYVNSAGQLVRGDQQIFMAQLRDGAPFTAGTFMTGKFPFMMFGLPAAALAIYHEAKPENKKYVAGIMGSAALTSFLTGITEPLEFSFLFVAPVLFAVHCVFAGLSFMTMHLLSTKIGMTFSGGLIDYMIFGVIPGRTPWWNVIIVGLILAVIYYFGFRFVIRKFNLKTPGREDAEVDENNDDAKPVTHDELPHNILSALGGSDNIVHLDACITRLRVEVKEKNEVSKDRLKKLGASGVLEVGNNIQAIFGTRSDTIKTQISDIMKGKTPTIAPSQPDASASAGKPAQVEQQAAQNGDAIIHEDIVMPANGELMDITKVPDPVFSEKMTGDGFAVLPHDGTIVSPVYGKVFNVFPSKHAVGIMSDGGKEVLVHIGVNTVKLKGQGFKVLVNEGDLVSAGQPIMEVDIAYVKEHAPSIISPIIFSNLPEGSVVELKKSGTLKSGEDNIITIK